MTKNPSSDSETTSPVLVAFGNPLLDIIVGNGGEDLVEKYNLVRNIAQELDTVNNGLQNEVTKLPQVSYSGGGCALNTVRVFQWLSGRPGESLFLGGLGSDESGAVLDSLVRGDGVRTAFSKQADRPTGHCIALVEGAERTLVANLGAASHYSVEDLWSGGNRSLLLGAKVIYVEGYFLAHSLEATLELAKFASEQGISFIFNLCGEYVCEDLAYVEAVLQVLPFIDVIFGNRSEFEVFIDTIEAKLSTSSVLIKNLRTMITGEGVENLDMKIENICESPVRSKPGGPQLVAVVTEGSKPVQCYSIGKQRLKTVAVNVPTLPQEVVKDTIGAGDSFIAGFIYVFLRGGSLRACIECAIWTAQKMIQEVGVTLPQKRPDHQFLQGAGKKGVKRGPLYSPDSVCCGASVSEWTKIKS